MMKKLIALLVAATMIFVLAGCGPKQEEAPGEAAPATEDVAEEPAEDVAGEDVAETPTVDAAANDAAGDIGVDKASEIALADAGLKESDVQFTKQNPDIDDGVNIYEIEFTSGETKYEYDCATAPHVWWK